MKILGVASAERAPAVPDIPTIAEQGLPDFRSITWFALVAPPETPAAIADKVNHDVAEFLQKPEMTEKLQNLRLDPMGGTRTDAAKFFADETALWGKVITENHVALQ